MLLLNLALYTEYHTAPTLMEVMLNGTKNFHALFTAAVMLLFFTSALVTYLQKY